MKYDKPQLIVLAAAEAIQHSSIKNVLLVMETFGQHQYATTAAYEADE